MKQRLGPDRARSERLDSIYDVGSFPVVCLPAREFCHAVGFSIRREGKHRPTPIFAQDLVYDSRSAPKRREVARYDQASRRFGHTRYEGGALGRVLTSILSFDQDEGKAEWSEEANSFLCCLGPVPDNAILPDNYWHPLPQGIEMTYNPALPR